MHVEDVVQAVLNLIQFCSTQTKMTSKNYFQIAGEWAEKGLALDQCSFDQWMSKALRKKHQLIQLLKLCLFSPHLQKLLFACCQFFEKLDLSGLTTSTDEEISQLATKNSIYVTELYLDDCLSLTNRSVIKFSHHCPNLAVLSLKNCVQIRFEENILKISNLIPFSLK